MEGLFCCVLFVALTNNHMNVQTQAGLIRHTGLLCSPANPADLPARTPTHPLSLQLPKDITLNSFQEDLQLF